MQNRSHYPSLLIVTSTEEVKWYKVFSDRIKKLKEATTNEWNLSVKEGHFEKSTKGKTLGTTGIDIENAEAKQIIEKHTKKVAEQTKELWDSKYKHLMLLAPDYLKNFVEDELEEKLNLSDFDYLEGNYTHESEDKLLELAKESLKVV